MSAAPHAARVLVVDDDEGMLLLITESLRAENYEVGTANSARTARAWLERHKPDLMILDLKLRDGNGPALVAELQRENAPVPFVVVTGQGDEKVAVEIMKQGALDYVMKDSALLDLLPTVVRRALAVVAQGKALAEAQAEHKRLEREILEAGERERHMIGADLHDGLGQQLTALEFLCTTLKEDAAAHPDLAQRIDLMGKMLREAIGQTRFLARGLVPVGSDSDSLQIGLTELVERANIIGRLRCVFECEQPVAVKDPFVARHLYRIAQEAVNNAVKHSNARQVVVRLARNSEQLVLEISDDGSGLSPTVDTNAGVGFGVMHHRAGMIGAKLTIDSRPGAGVTITSCLPLEK